MSDGYSAWFYDGNNAVRRSVDVDVVGAKFLLNANEARFGPFELTELTYVSAQGQKGKITDVYGLKGKDGWRLGLSGNVPAELSRLLPARRRYGGWVDRLGFGPATISFALISAAVVAIVLFTPQWLAPLIPPGVEKKIGDTMVGDFGGRFCHTQKGSAALQKLVRSLDPDPSDLQVEVAKIDMINAVALPGGKVILFDGLVKEARSPDEVAGVLAHEIGHVRERHVMQSLLRQLGLSLVLGGLDGNSSGLLNGALSMSYSRASESQADTHSIDAMARANISPVATADFFQRLSAMDGSDRAQDKTSAISGYMSSHPLSSARKKAFERSLVKGRNYKPALTPSQWQELKTMCTQDRKAKSGFGFDFGG